MLLRCRTRTLDLSRPIVMGIVNVTPDSFSDGGRYQQADRAIEHGIRMAHEGAALIDVGGESTRPGAKPVGEQEELDRVIPVIRGLRQALEALEVSISIDTSKPIVMKAAVEAGAELINDVYALRAPGALEAAAASGAAVCLMHMQGEPRTMQSAPQYGDVVLEVCDFLKQRIEASAGAGISLDRLLIDPGIGFGKRLEHNLALLASISELAALERPVLIGVSRKSMFDALLGRALDDRLPGALAAAITSVLAGARIIRTHDVRETADALATVAALEAAGYRTPK